MAEDGQVTPEKQLLNLIEGSGPGKSKGGEKLKRGGPGFFSLGALRGLFFGKFSFFKRSAKSKIGAARKAQINFVFVNRVLAVLALFLFIYAVTDTVASALNMKAIPNFTLQNDKGIAAGVSEVSALKEEAYYLQKVTTRDIFREARAVVQKKVVVPAATSKVTRNFSLVGISWSANPDAIIEDKDQQRTYFVKRGQMVGNDVKVEAIFKDKVVLSSEGQEFELR